MKKIVMLIAALGAIASTACAQNNTNMETIELNQPDLGRGKVVMQALSERKSTREFAARDISLQDMSDLLWAANGVNRPGGMRTAPSARNRQDVKVYVCKAEGSYLYDHTAHALVPLSEGDSRPTTDSPVVLALVSDTNEMWGALDAGIVSQNISVFCAAVGMATYPRGTFDKDALTKALKTSGNQTILLVHPVGYFK